MKRGVIDPLTDELWLELVHSTDTDVFHSPPWLRALARTYDFEPRATILTDEATGAPIAGMPFCVVDGLPAKRIAAPPFSDYCDPIVTDVGQWAELIEPLLKEECPVSVRCLHNEVPIAAGGFNVVNQAAWHGLDLAADLDDIWAGIDGSARRAIRKAGKQGVEVRPAVDVRELRAFFDLHLRIRKYKYRLLAQPFALFENLWDEFVAAGNGSVRLAFHEGRIVGGVFFLEWKDRLYYKFNASDPDFVDLRPNDAIIWSAVQAAKAGDLRRLDFGLSDTEQEGLVRYKRKYASDEKMITFLRYEHPSADTAGARQMRRTLPELTRILTDDGVPDIVTERAGDLLYGLFA